MSRGTDASGSNSEAFVFGNDQGKIYRDTTRRIEGAEPAVDRTKQAVLDAVVSERFVSQAEMAKALGVHEATVSRKLKELEREGLLTEEAKRAHFRAAKEGGDQTADAVSEASEETPAESF
jgi:uncharacterized membrane protein